MSGQPYMIIEGHVNESVSHKEFNPGEEFLKQVLDKEKGNYPIIARKLFV